MSRHVTITKPPPSFPQVFQAVLHAASKDIIKLRLGQTQHNAGCASCWTMISKTRTHSNPEILWHQVIPSVPICADCFVEEWAPTMDTSVLVFHFVHQPAGKRRPCLWETPLRGVYIHKPKANDHPGWVGNQQEWNHHHNHNQSTLVTLVEMTLSSSIPSYRCKPHRAPNGPPTGPQRAPTHPTFKRRWSCDGPRAPSSPSAITEILYDSPLVLLRCCRMLRERPKRFNIFVGLKSCLEDSCLWIKSVLRSFNMPIFLGVWCSAARPLYQGTIINPHHATSSVPGESRQTKGVSQYFQARFFEWWFQHGILLTTATGIHWVLGIATPRVRSHLPSSNIPLFFAAALEEFFSKKNMHFGVKIGNQCQPASFHFLVSFEEHVRLIMINPSWLWPVTTQLLSIQVRPFPLLMYGIIVLAIAQHSTCQELSWNKGGKKRKHLQKSCCCFN